MMKFDLCIQFEGVDLWRGAALISEEGVVSGDARDQVAVVFNAIERQRPELEARFAELLERTVADLPPRKWLER